MRVDRTSVKWVAALLGLSATALALSGCGGGGGGGGTATPSYTYSGKVTGESESVSGFKVVYNATSYEATLNSGGTFSISVPVSKIGSGTDVLNVYDTSGDEVGIYTISTTGSVSGIAITVVGLPGLPPI
jgi:hypothetical protein